MELGRSYRVSVRHRNGALDGGLITVNKQTDEQAKEFLEFYFRNHGWTLLEAQQLEGEGVRQGDDWWSLREAEHIWYEPSAEEKADDDVRKEEALRLRIAIERKSKRSRRVYEKAKRRQHKG